MAEAGEFSLIVTAVDSASLQNASEAFARAFSLDETISQQICKSAPIIFAQKLTKAEVKSITPVLQELSGQGMEFRITARLAARLPKVNWPSRPQFTAGGSAGVNGLAFQWDNNAFVCPGCGESFLFRRLGKLQLSEEAGSSNGPVVAEAAPALAPAPRSAPARVAPAPQRAPVAAPLDFSDDLVPEPQLEGVEGVKPLAGEGESLDLPDTMEEVSLEEASASEPLLGEAPDAAELLPMEEGGDFSVAAEEVPEPVAEPSAAPMEEEAGAEGGDLYNVFLSKITDTTKRDKAAELIGKVKGCATAEAKELTTRLVIPLAKNVSKKKAEDILELFKKLKIFGRMTKVK